MSVNYRTGRYSSYLRPISYIIDLAIIVFLSRNLFMNSDEYVMFIIYIIIAWVILSLQSKFYEIYRYTRLVKIISLTITQMILFVFIVFAFFGFFDRLEQTPLWVTKYLFKVFFLIMIAKLGVYYILKRYRRILGGNYRNTVIVGKNAKTRQLKQFFDNNPEYGYKLSKLFKINSKTEELDSCFDYIVENEIDEIYCSVAELNDKQIKEFVSFADNNLKKLKFLPDHKEIFTKKLNYDYYGYLPVLSLREIPLDDSINKFLKRTFDIFMSGFVLVFILSWLTPLIGLLIKLESKGPIFFKQKRNGLDYQEFDCYKYRSMRPNDNANSNQASRGDMRVTKVGKFIRKTSIDELPQFINVLKGDMSVVGPRPHMVKHTEMYAERVDKFMVRHFVKPGITGLAQTSGFRGEIESDSDIVNRVKYDIFYVENWSLLLDIKIIVQTVVNAMKGEEKAY